MLRKILILAITMAIANTIALSNFAQSPATTRQLQLPETPFNYSRIKLPSHFQTAASAMDNTPSDNPITDHGATLGRVLFYDKSLSVNGTTACASCHKQQAAFTDDARFSVGFDGRKVTRNSMSLVNVRYHANNKFFWDQRAPSLEAQVLMPIENSIEMGHRLEALIPQLQQDPIYPRLFENAFGSPTVTSTRLAQALAQFVRSIVSYQSPYDHGRQAVESVRDPFPNFTMEQNEGKRLFFGEARCAACHMMQLPPHPLAPQNLTTHSNLNEAETLKTGVSTGAGFNKERNRHDRYSSDVPRLISESESTQWNQTAFFYPGIPLANGVDGIVEGTDGGVGPISEQTNDFGKFKTPSLRNVAVTGPYMHDGRFVTLDAVVEHYNWSVRPHPNLDERLADLPARGLALQQSETEALVAFLMTLTDTHLLADERFSDPFVANKSTTEELKNRISPR